MVQVFHALTVALAGLNLRINGRASGDVHALTVALYLYTCL
jgi:hypothetical protein